MKKITTNRILPHKIEAREVYAGISLKKIIGVAIFLIAVGMLLMLFVTNRLIGLIMMLLLLFAAYTLYTCD